MVKYHKQTGGYHMSYYLRKHWKMNLLIFLLQLISSALIINQNIVLINSVQGIFDTDLHQFYFWMIVDTVLWIVIVALRSVLKWLKSRTIRSLNNDLRADIVASLLKKTHKEFHDQQSGEYMSWLTNDIGQIEGLAWQTFFTVITTTQIFQHNCTSKHALVATSSLFDRCGNNYLCAKSFQQKNQSAQFSPGAVASVGDKQA